MTGDATRRMFPKVLADELSLALSVVRGLSLSDERVTELLGIFRRNNQRLMVHIIATHGISKIRTTVDSPVDGIEHFPYEYYRAFEMLDEAFKKLHSYRNGGAVDYMARDVVREINRQHGKKPKSRKTNHDAISDHLIRRGYETSDNKKSLVLNAMELFGVSESTIRRAMGFDRMTRK